MARRRRTTSSPSLPRGTPAPATTPGSRRCTWRCTTISPSAAARGSRNLSIADKPTFSDGNKTVTIQLKKGYKWNDGHPVDAQDLLFDIALIKVAVGESAANWGTFTPGYFPQNVASVKATGPYTVVMHLKRAYNPGFFLNNELALNITPLPSRSWNVTSPHGPHLNWKVPANARKIYDYLGKVGGQVGTFASNPLWKIADGPYKLASFSPVTSSWTLTAAGDCHGPCVNSYHTGPRRRWRAGSRRSVRAHPLGRQAGGGVAVPARDHARGQQAVQDRFLGCLDDRGEELVQIPRLDLCGPRSRSGGRPAAQPGSQGQKDLAAAVACGRACAGEAQAGSPGQTDAGG